MNGPDLTLNGRTVLILAALRAGALQDHDDQKRTRPKVHILPGLALTIADRAELYRANARIYR